MSSNERGALPTSGTRPKVTPEVSPVKIQSDQMIRLVVVVVVAPTIGHMVLYYIPTISTLICLTT